MEQNVTPFYHPSFSYEENYHHGPFGAFNQKPNFTIDEKNPSHFLNIKINLPFGIPAGPLLNAKYIKAALAHGFDLCVYKTVRTKAYQSHPLPNVLSVHPKGRLSAKGDTVLADTNYKQPVSITNSFGVPSFSPDVWQADLADAVSFAKQGQCVIGSFQGTIGHGKSLIEDYVLAAKLVKDTGAPILEANLSCPNEGAAHLLCFDIDKVERIAKEIKNAVPDHPLLLKLAYFACDEELKLLLNRLNGTVDGFSCINTLSAKPVDKNGKPALGTNRIIGGVCGDAIRWAGIDMVQRLNRLRHQLSAKFAIIGVGGVNSVEHYHQYLQSGADAVMSATGAMWNPHLAFEIKQGVQQSCFE